MSVNNEAKIKAILAISLFIISMVIVASLSYEYGRQAGYSDGYADADEDWQNYLNEVLGPFVDYVYREGYIDGYDDGYLWGYVEGWREYSTEEDPFRYPDGGRVP